MGKGSGKGAMEEHVEVLQYVIYVFNTIFFCAAAAIFAVGLWVRFDEYTIDYVQSLSMEFYWIGSSVVMSGAALVMIGAFLACCGAFFRSRLLLLSCGAACIFAIGLWIHFDKDSSEYMGDLSMNFYNTATSIIMAGACLIMVTSFIACCGAFFRFRTLLIVYKVMTVITFLLLLGGSAYILDNGMEDSRLYPYIQEEFRKLIYRYQWDVTARRAVDIIQEQVGCCGGYSAGDYSAIHLPVPDTCRDQNTGNQYGDSCAEIFAQYIEVRTGWITGLSLSLCFLQLFAVMFAFCMWQGVREVKNNR